jgi:hypothetical protein
VDFSRPGVSANKGKHIANNALPNNSNLHSSVFGEEYGLRGARMTGILLRFARKTDSAGWLQILLPWSWN